MQINIVVNSFAESHLSEIRKIRREGERRKEVRSKDSVVNQVIKHLRDRLGIKVHGREEMMQYLEKHGRGDAQEYIDKSTIDQSELKTIGSNLIQRYGNNKDYGCFAYTANYCYLCNYNGEGDFDIISRYEIDNNLNDIVDDEEGRGTETYDSLSERDGSAKRKRVRDSYDVEERRTDRDNAGLDSRPSQGKSVNLEDNNGGTEHRKTRFIKTGWDGSTHLCVLDIIDIISVFSIL